MTSINHAAAPPQEGGPITKCGYVTLLGAPNVGKSTLLNALVGTDLSIVTPKAQTTWHRVTGILTSSNHQLIFLDTPGILEPRGLLQRSLLHSAAEAVAEADINLVICDPVRTLGDSDRSRLLEILDSSAGGRIGIVNKVDVAQPEAIDVERVWLQSLSVASVHLVSASQGTGLEGLLHDLEERLPPGPFLYPADEIASAPERFFVAEMVRQAIFEQFHQEVPYASICRVEEFRDTGERAYIQVTIYVERSSQKGIIIGDAGKAIRKLGTTARQRIEHFLERPVYLDLWVKVLAGWRRKPEQLRRLGLPVPQENRER